MGDLPSRRTRTGNELTDQIFEGPLKHVSRLIFPQMKLINNYNNLNFYFAGDPPRRGLLPDHEAAYGQPQPSERGAGLGAHVAGHGAVRVLAGAHEGAQPGTGRFPSETKNICNPRTIKFFSP